MSTYLQGAIKAGEGPSEVASGVGTAVMQQTVTLQAASAANVDATITLPKNGRIVDFQVDSTVAWTATTAGLTIGTTAGGTQYVSSMDVKTITRGPTAAYTAAQLAAMDYTTNTTVAIRVASTGANAVGTTRVTVQYVILAQ